MRKLLVVLAVLLAVGLFAGAQYNFGPGGAGNWSAASPVTFDGTITVYVYQWMNVSLEVVNSLEVMDYGSFGPTNIATLTIQSNADVSLEATVTLIQSPSNFQNHSGVTVDLFIDNAKKSTVVISHGFSKSGSLPLEYNSIKNEKTFIVSVKSDIPASLPAGTYKFEYKLTLKPTVSF